MRDLPEDLANEPVRHNWAWWRYALFKFMAGPNSWAVIGLILVVSAIGGGIVRLVDGDALPGIGLLALGVLGLVAFATHFEREYMIRYLEDRNELIRQRDVRRADRTDPSVVSSRDERPETHQVEKANGWASTFEDWGEFQIEFEHKEVCIYWEGDRGCAFASGWGHRPYTTYVPSVDRWDDVVPAWMKARRREVLDRLARSTSHRLEVVRELAVATRPAERWGPPGLHFSGGRPGTS